MGARRSIALWAFCGAILLLALLAACSVEPGGLTQAKPTDRPAGRQSTILPTPSLPSAYIPPSTHLPPTPVTSTPAPTPTPFFPPQEMQEWDIGWVVLPAPLYFLRDGRLWEWPANGAAIQAISPAEGPGSEPIVDYDLTADEQRIAYLTAAGNIFVLDRSGGQARQVAVQGAFSTEVSYYGFLLNSAGENGVSGDQFALTPEGRYLVYVGWGVKPSSNGGGALGPGPAAIAGQIQYNTVLAVDLEDSDRQFELGPCVSDKRGPERIFACQGFVLSPDGTQVAFAEANGLWVAAVPGGSPRLMIQHNHRRFGSFFMPASWSPSGRWLLIQIAGYEWYDYGVIDVNSGEIRDLPQVTDNPSSQVHMAWGSDGLWVAKSQSAYGNGRSFWQGTLSLFDPSIEGPLTPTRQITPTLEGPLVPVGLQPFSDGHVGFAQTVCDGQAQTSLFILRQDDTLHHGAVFPSLGCQEGEGWPIQTRIAWTGEESTFLYTDRTGNPLLLGRVNGTGVWDVRSFLSRARVLRWGAPAGPPIPGQGPIPVSTRQDIERRLFEFSRARAEAEMARSPAPLSLVSVNPYLAEKTARIQANAQEGSYWETRASEMTVLSISLTGDVSATVRVRRSETKLFFPAGASDPDDMTCPATILSYRGCTYEAEYGMVLKDGQWYVATAQAEGNCPAVCRKPAVEGPAPTPARLAASDPWPSLPADLYFLRDGKLWRWPAGGGEPEALALGSGEEQVTRYQVETSGHYLVYFLSSGYWQVLDLASGNNLLPDAGLSASAIDASSLVANGQYLAYTEPSGILRILDLTALQDYPLVDQAQDPMISPDGRLVAWENDGIWVAQLPDGEPVQLIQNVPPEERYHSVWELLGWLADSQHLLVQDTFPNDYSARIDYSLSILNAGTGTKTEVPNSFCGGEEGEYCEWAIGPAGVWVSASPENAAYSAFPALLRVQVSAGESVQVVEQIYGALDWNIAPTHMVALPDGRAAFVYQGCTEAATVSPGIVVTEPDGTLRRVAFLPTFSCSEVDDKTLGLVYAGQVAWAPDGSAFIYMDRNGSPLTLGWMDGSAVWDVHELLAGARAFQWSTPIRR